MRFGIFHDGLARAVDRADDALLERCAGSRIAQRTVFTRMTRAFEPRAAAGFQGRIVYELTRPATGGGPIRWTIEILDGHATAQPGTVQKAELTLYVQLADFVRIAGGAIDPAAPLLAGRASIDGDFALAARLPEMFGAPRRAGRSVPSRRRRAPR